MELAFLPRGVGAEFCWITNQKPPGPDEVVYNLENKMLDRGVQVFSAKDQEAINTALKANLVILNTVVVGKWLDVVLAKNGRRETEEKEVEEGVGCDETHKRIYF
ncbi:putative Glycosyl-transferase family 4_5 [Helianthus anomalus]